MDGVSSNQEERIDLSDQSPFRLGGAQIDPVAREARIGGEVERLQPQNLKVLVALARSSGKVVTRDRLVDLCWDGRFVGDDVINRAISTLRQFAERAGGFEIQTVPRSGYRLVESGSPSRRFTGGLRIAAVLLGLAVLVAAAVALLVPEDRDQPWTLAVAILPVTSDRSDADSVRLAQATRDSLARMLSDSGYSVKLADSRQEGRAGADLMLSATVEKGAAGPAATIRLEETRHNSVVSTNRIEASDSEADALPDRVGAHVAGLIGWMRPLLAIEMRHPSDPAILASAIRHNDEQVGDTERLSSYQTSRHFAAEAPNSVLAQLQLAFNSAFILPILPRDERDEAVALGREAADRLRTLAPEFGDAWSPWCVLHSNVRMAECEALLRKAMQADFDSPFVDWFIADRLKDYGLFGDSLDLARSSLARDPYAPAKISMMLRLQDANGQSAGADALFRQAVRLWPENPDFLGDRVSGMIDRGDFEAIARLGDSYAKHGWPDGFGDLSSVVTAWRSHDRSTAMAACPTDGPNTLRTIMCILVLADSGDQDGAFAIAANLYPRRVGRDAAEEDRIWLDKPFVTGTEFITGTGARALRRDPRYLDLAERLGLLQYWRSGHSPDFCRSSPEPVCKSIARS